MGLAAGQFSYSDTTNFTKVTFNVTDGELKINPVDELVITITGNKAEYTYDGTEKTVTGYTAESDNELFDESLIEFTGKAEVSGTDADT